MPPRQLLYRLAVTLALSLASPVAWSEDGVSANEIRIGMVNAQSGPASGLGSDMKTGVQAYFTRVNATGGVHGRTLSLIVKDDGYEPTRSAARTEDLINRDNVFALLGYVGTPTSRAALPIAMRAEVPYLFPFSGAEFLRTPVKKWVFNLRASYLDETETLVEHLNTDLGVTKIALLMQDDSFGESVKSGVSGALSKRNLGIHAEARINRNSLDMVDAVAALKHAQPEAIFFVGTYRQLSAAIKAAQTAGIRARFVTVSFIGTEDFIAAAGPSGDGVYITQVMPSPHDTSLAIVRQYLADVPPADVGYTSLEGYINANVFVQALQAAGVEPTRSKLANALKDLNTDIAGFPVHFSPGHHQGSSAVFLTRIQAGKALPVGRMQ